MLKNKSKKMMIAASVSCLLLIPSQVQAFEPITLLTGLISPIACKVIGCKEETTKYLFVERPAENQKRLAEMRDNFQWGGYYEEGDCRKARKGLDKEVTVCYTSKEWKVMND